MPGGIGIECSFVVPAPKEGEDLAAEGAREDAVYFVHGPNKMPFHGAQYLGGEILFEIGVGTQAVIPNVLGPVVEIESVGNRLSQRLIEIHERFQVTRIEFLKIGQHDLAALISGFSKTAGEEGCLANLSCPLNQDRALSIIERLFELVVDLPGNVEVGV